jgi:hypothetical protein
MKVLIVGMLALVSAQAFCADLNTTIHDIEVNKNAKCTKTKTSWGLNLGGALGVTFFTVKYHCQSNTGDFDLKVRMRNGNVRKVIYTK